jgi:arylsulfatase A-like enzyme
MLQKLEEMGELDHTLVLFTSDNGPHSEGKHDHEFFNSNGELKGFKRDLYEGGIRVPFIAYWKGRIEPGTVSGYVAGFQDFMPTIAEAVGVQTPGQSNGISMLPVLFGETGEGHAYMHWEFQRPDARSNSFRQSVRMDQWKAVRYGIDSQTELYNLETDLSEENNIASEHNEMVKQMNRLFEESRTDNSYYPYGGIKE